MTVNHLYTDIKKAVREIKCKDGFWGMNLSAVDGPAWMRGDRSAGIRVSFYGVTPERVQKALAPLGGQEAHRDAAGNNIIIVKGGE